MGCQCLNFEVRGRILLVFCQSVVLIICLFTKMLVQVEILSCYIIRWYFQVNAKLS